MNNFTKFLVRSGILRTKKRIKLGVLKAYDHAGRNFNAVIEYHKGIISLGWPVEYRLKDIKPFLEEGNQIYIDIRGTNHKGSPTYILKKDLKSLLKQYKLI